MKVVAVAVGVVILVAVACFIAGTKSLLDKCQGVDGTNATNQELSDCVKSFVESFGDRAARDAAR
jgi:hypothetical protein